ncbi:MAG: phosphoribosylformylglycinamidine synthase subunit PurL [Rhodospirillaceae bacterium]|jgi:phosphoribosylformylglycinamidine synthase|nr:phosphoribosylformylglycinamidine synthase subunit PurL [Rhodospirillaceae bacterium]
MIINKSSPIALDVIKAHGLTTEEYQRLLSIIGREPNITELGIFSVMWSEHCSYKSSKKWLKLLPTTAPWVICGPGENAGIIDIGDGQAVVFKMESHNHPSFIEPYQGAATGVGGILRDVFTMGARPIANLNALRFGDPSHPKTRNLISGVIAGIGDYGNCVGVPTIGGETNFHASYNGNILVNAMTVGLVQTDRIFYSVATGVGNLVVYVGSKTGRDGIHGATMASTEFSEDSDEEKRPTVQVGDPFTEKLLIEACLEIMSTDSIIAIQDMGAAGLTSSSFEMVSKSGLGIEMNLDSVPTREINMTSYDIMLSESQERMLMILKPNNEEMARAIFEKWELDFAVIGHLTDSGRMVIKHHGKTVSDLPIDPLINASPEYDRQFVAVKKRQMINIKNVSIHPPIEALKTLISCPDLSSKRWIYEQYDYRVMNDTIGLPGTADAGIVRVHGTNKALALTTDCTPRYCVTDPREGGRQAVVEAYRNLSSVGALPLAITDNLNFGNPEKPEIMGQIVEIIKGMSEACNVLDFPVVSGNVSLYNETNGEAILPTPVIGAVGLIYDIKKISSLSFKKDGDIIILLGDTKGCLGSSLYLRELCDSEDGAPPQVDPNLEKLTGCFVRKLIFENNVTAVHDISDGGLLVAIAEMSIASGIGAIINAPQNEMLSHAWYFGEDQCRYVLTVSPDLASIVLSTAKFNKISVQVIGKTGGDSLILNGEEGISVTELKQLNDYWLPDFMESAS